MSNSRYDVAKVRQKVREKLKTSRDPDEFRPPKAEDDKTYRFRFYVLPPFNKGDSLRGGKASGTMDTFFIQSGSHFIDKQFMGCPRVIEEDECPICQYAFDLMGEVEEDSSLSAEEKKDQKSGIARRLLPPQYNSVNIYFPGGKLGACNPEDLQDRVMWYNAPQTVFKIWMECLDRDDDGGDSLKPQAFGVFFDELNAYLFELVVYKKGRGNSYEKSNFLVTESFQAHPLAVANKKLEPNEERIAEILEQRFDLFAKLPQVDHKKINAKADALKGNSSSDSGGFDHDEGEEEAKSQKDSGKKSNKSNKSKKGLTPPISEKSEKKSEKKDKKKSDDDDFPFEIDSDDDSDSSDSSDIADEVAMDDESDDDSDDSDLDSEVDDLLNQLD